MELNMHNVESVEVEKNTYNTFETLTLTFTDKDGQEMKVNLYTSDLAKLNINTATIKTRQW